MEHHKKHICTYYIAVGPFRNPSTEHRHSGCNSSLEPSRTNVASSLRCRWPNVSGNPLREGGHIPSRKLRMQWESLLWSFHNFNGSGLNSAHCAEALRLVPHHLKKLLTCCFPQALKAVDFRDMGLRALGLELTKNIRSVSAAVTESFPRSAARELETFLDSTTPFPSDP